MNRRGKSNRGALYGSRGASRRGEETELGTNTTCRLSPICRWTKAGPCQRLVRADVFRPSGAPAIYLFAVPSARRFLSLPCSNEARRARAGAVMFSLVFVVSAFILCIQWMIIPCVCRHSECSMRLHLVLGRSSLISGPVSVYTFRSLRGAPNALSLYGLLDFPFDGSQEGHGGGMRMRRMWGFSPGS